MINNYPEWLPQAIELLDTGMSKRAIARELDIGRTSCREWLSKFEDGLLELQPVDVLEVKRKPKVLIFDLETSPELSYHFGRYQVNINDVFNVAPSYLLSFSAKWLGESETVTIGLPYYNDYDPSNLSDKRLCEDLHKLLSDADVVVAHNLKGFDWKVAQTRFLLNDLEPISPTKLVDTLHIARANFRFPTNKLDTIARQLGLGSKLTHSGASLWLGCLENNEDDWKTMIDYNEQDVLLLEEVYLALRAYDKQHPNLALFYDDQEPRCVCCGSKSLTLTTKKSYTGLSEFDIYQCDNCGKHNRSRKNNLTKEKRQSLLMNAGN